MTTAWVLASALLDPLAAPAVRLLPSGLNAGKRTHHAVRAMRSVRSLATPAFSRAVLVSTWRSALLLRYLEKLSTPELDSFLRRKVRAEGMLPWEQLGAGSRPLLFVTPHYGACVSGCLALASWLRNRHSLCVYYELNRGNSGMQELLSRTSSQVEAVNVGPAGLRRAVRTLRAGGCVAMMPDLYLSVSATVAVPFMGRWLRAPTGTAYLALKSDALIVPAYATASRSLDVLVRFRDPIDPRSVRSGDGDRDEAQERFMLTCLVFADIERALRQAPEHWMRWEWLPKMSTPLDLPESLSGTDLRAILAARCRAFPSLAARMPELAGTGVSRAGS